MPKIVDVYESEARWLEYMTNRSWHSGIAKNIIKLSPSKNNVEYMGSYLLPLEESFADRYMKRGDSQLSLDIVFMTPTKLASKKLSKTYGKTQVRFPNLQALFKSRFPPKGKVGVYFFGEVHDEEGFIHWNACFIEDNEICFYDPAME